MKIKPSLDLITDKKDPLDFLNKKEKDANITKSSPDIQQPANAVQQGSEHPSKHVHFPPIPDTVQDIHSQTQFKPYPPQIPLIRGHSDTEHSCPQKEAYMNKTRSKYGHKLKIQPCKAIRSLKKHPTV